MAERAPTDITRDIALGFISDIAAGRREAAFARLAEDAIFEIVAPPPVGGLYDKRTVGAVAQTYIHSLCEAPPTLTLLGATVEGCRAAIEAEGHAVLLDGTAYRNRYHYLLVVHDGLIVELREYLDSAYLLAMNARVGPLRGQSRG